MIKLNEIFELKLGMGIMGIMLLLIVIYFVFFPLCVAWSLNHLFNLSIGYTFDTWVAVTIINGFFHGMIKTK